MKITGERIKNLRKDKFGWSQEELAERMGYKGKSAISRIEKGQYDLNQSKIKAFANVLGTTPAYLMGWIDDDAPAAKLEKNCDYIVTRDDEIEFVVNTNDASSELAELVSLCSRLNETNTKNAIRYMEVMLELQRKEDQQ